MVECRGGGFLRASGANWTVSIRPPIFDDMTAKEQGSVRRVADREKLLLLLDKARQFETRFASRARSSLPLRLYLLSRRSLSSIAGEYIYSLEKASDWMNQERRRNFG